MVSKIHVVNKYLKLENSQENQLSQYTSPTKALNSINRCFVPIKEIKNSIYPHYKIISFSKKDVSYLDMVNTLAYLRNDNNTKKNQWGKRWSPISLDYRGDTVSFETWDSSDTIHVKLHRDTLHVIQYGVACTVACNKRTLSFVDVCSFPWIIRAWCDKDERVFRHGVRSLVGLMSHKKHSLDIHEENARLLPDIFKYIGGNDKNEFGWEKVFYEDFLNENHRFIQSILAVIVLPKARTNIYLSEEGYQWLKRCLNLPPVMKAFFEVAVKTSRGEYVFNACQSVYYKWLLDKFKKDEKLLLQCIMYVRVRFPTKVCVPRKRKKRKRERNFKFRRRCMEYKDAYDGYLNREYCQTEDLPRDGITYMAWFIGFIEMRNWHIRENDDDLRYHCRWKGNTCGNTIVHAVIKKSRQFNPVVQYPRGVGLNIGVANMSFPILKMSKKMHGEVSEIIGDSLSKYFFKKNSFSM